MNRARPATWPTPSDYRAAGVTLKVLPLILPLIACQALAAQAPPSPEELQRWFEDDSEQRAAEVSEGELRFLPSHPTRADGRPLPWSDNRLTITAASLADSWVQLEQCHHELDAVAEAQVVYRYKQMRNLRVLSAQHIGAAWVEGNSIQLQDVQRDARLCIAAAVRILHREADGGFRLINGPYHRKFLDGYYPYRVRLEVEYANAGLGYRDVSPAPQPGFQVSHDNDRVNVDAWFEGELTVELRFSHP